MCSFPSPRHRSNETRNHRQGLPLPDPYLKLHDVRFLRPLSPIPFPVPPAFVRFHPRISSTVIVSSLEGRVQMLDLKDVAKGTIFQVSHPWSSVVQNRLSRVTLPCPPCPSSPATSPATPF